MDDSGSHSLGPVLADGMTVAGDTVNLCAKVTATIQPGEIRVKKSARVGSVARPANVMTLRFLSALPSQSPTEMTTVSNITPYPR